MGGGEGYVERGIVGGGICRCGYAGRYVYVEKNCRGDMCWWCMRCVCVCERERERERERESVYVCMFVCDGMGWGAVSKKIK